MNASHEIFYYPYANLTDAQAPLLKVAAIYFDKLVLLDPVGASRNTVGASRNTVGAEWLLDWSDGKKSYKRTGRIIF